MRSLREVRRHFDKYNNGQKVNTRVLMIRLPQLVWVWQRLPVNQPDVIDSVRFMASIEKWFQIKSDMRD